MNQIWGRGGFICQYFRRNYRRNINCCRWHLFPSVIPTGNKLKCAPKFSKLPPFVFICRWLPTELFLSVGDYRRPTIPSVIAHLWQACALGRVISITIPSVIPSVIVAQAHNFFPTLCEILTALFRRCYRL